MDEETKEAMIEMAEMPQGPMSDVEIKMQLLHLAKDIIQQNAAMRWETHKRCEDVSVDMVIKEARKLIKFVNK
tara:strand:- start:1151 stop:1369 length:219 start_codon:yes stop_codon:yes gene_type:complete